MSEVETGVITSETPAPAGPEPAVTATPESPQQEAPVAPVEKTFTQKEVDQLVAKRAAIAERRAGKEARALFEAEFYRKQYEATQQKPPTQPVANGKPQVDQFKDYNEYIEALTDWKLEQKEGAKRQESETQSRQREQMEFAGKVQSRFAKATEQYPDFHDVIAGEGVAITMPMLDAMIESEIGDKLAYHVASDPELSQKISAMSPARQVRELLSIEAELMKPPTPTRTPPPIEPNNTSASSSKDLKDLGYEDFVKQRRKQIASR